MASFSCPSPYPVRCSANRDGHDTNKPKLKINGSGISSSSSAGWSRTKIDNNGVSATTTSVSPVVTENECIIPLEEQLRQNIPTKKQFVDSHRLGLIIEGGVGYRQTVVIRSYEVGPDKTTTIESILNLLQKTRRLSKMPEEVRAEISPWFIHKQAIKEDNPAAAAYVILQFLMTNTLFDIILPSTCYIQAIPGHVLESQQLCGIIMEYRRECGSSDIVESLCEPDDDGILEEGVLLEHGAHINLLNGFMEGNGLLGSFNKAPQKFTHLL